MTVTKMIVARIAVCWKLVSAPPLPNTNPTGEESWIMTEWWSGGVQKE